MKDVKDKIKDIRFCYFIISFFEEILGYDEYDPSGLVHYLMDTGRYEELKKELSTLIQLERKEAVEEFRDFIKWKKPSDVMDIMDDVIDGRSLVKQVEEYLKESEKE